MARIGLLDYGSGNLHSVQRAFELTGSDVVLGQHRDHFEDCDGLVVPGVGAFAACMAGLQRINADKLIRDWVSEGRALLGICVGHQVLFTRGIEHGVDCPGVGIFTGTVERLRATRLPHMGWNTVQWGHGSRIRPDNPAARFYFVHSFGVRHGPDAITSWVTHEQDHVLAAVEWGSVTATQFHPEKSGAAGAALLQAWVKTIR